MPSMTVAVLVSQALTLSVMLVLVRSLRWQRQRERTYTAAIRGLQDDVAALCNGAVGVGDHLFQVERYLHRVSERQDRADMNDSSYQSFDYAVRLARSGAGVERIMTDCGLARSEAELIAALNRADVSVPSLN